MPLVQRKTTLKWKEETTSWWLNHPVEKHTRQIGSFPIKVGGKNTKHGLSCHQPEPTSHWNTRIIQTSFHVTESSLRRWTNVAVSANYNQLGKPQNSAIRNLRVFNQNPVTKQKRSGETTQKGKGSGFIVLAGGFSGSICMSFSIRYLHFKKWITFRFLDHDTQIVVGVSTHHLRPNENHRGAPYVPNHSDSFSTPDCRLKKPWSFKETFWMNKWMAMGQN